jgi:hypothetical protein
VYESPERIIENYLRQIEIKLPSDFARTIIPELRAHLIEEASVNGGMSVESALQAIANMGSPESIIKEYETQFFDEEYASPEPKLISSKYYSLFTYWTVAMIIFNAVVLGFIVMFGVLLKIPKRIFVLRSYLPIILFQVSVLACIACVFLGFYILSRTEISPWKNTSYSRNSHFEPTRLLVQMVISLVLGVLLIVSAFWIKLVTFPRYPLSGVYYILFMGIFLVGGALILGLRAVVDSDLRRKISYFSVTYFSLCALILIGILFLGLTDLLIPIIGRRFVFNLSRFLFPRWIWVYPILASIILLLNLSKKAPQLQHGDELR